MILFVFYDKIQAGFVDNETCRQIYIKISETKDNIEKAFRNAIQKIECLKTETENKRYAREKEYVTKKLIENISSNGTR